jgi:hypothetical protein
VFKASLSTGAELHTVVGSTARGSFLLGFNPDGSMHFFLNVRNLSGAVSGAHLHGPATASQTAPVLLTLCGAGPAQASVATCTVTNGLLSIEGDITSVQLAASGLAAKDFIDALEASLVYVNVHTALNPAGEARGQVIPQ